MKIFISWSDHSSKCVAVILRDWLPDVIQSVLPWMSDVDIETGKRWNNDIQNILEESNFGILCLTKENVVAPWLLFESGALAKSLKYSYVCPFLFDMELNEIPRGPLTQFQSVIANKEGTWKLVNSVNSALKENALTDEKLHRSFERCWPEIERKLRDIERVNNSSVVPSRSTEDMIAEILESVRNLSRIPVKFFPVQSEQSIDFDVLSVLHDLGKRSDKFQQSAGRIKRKKGDDDDDGEENR